MPDRSLLERPRPRPSGAPMAVGLIGRADHDGAIVECPPTAERPRGQFWGQLPSPLPRHPHPLLGPDPRDRDADLADDGNREEDATGSQPGRSGHQRQGKKRQTAQEPRNRSPHAPSAHAAQRAQTEQHCARHRGSEADESESPGHCDAIRPRENGPSELEGCQRGTHPGLAPGQHHGARRRDDCHDQQDQTDPSSPTRHRTWCRDRSSHRRWGRDR